MIKPWSASQGRQGFALLSESGAHQLVTEPMSNVRSHVLFPKIRALHKLIPIYL